MLNLQPTLTMIIFNVFFLSLFSLLNGSPATKAGMLAAGNVVGVLWNFFFQYLSAAGDTYFGFTFNAFFIIIYPVLNLMWIVPFWSLSLSFLPKLSPQTTAVKP